MRSASDGSAAMSSVDRARAGRRASGCRRRRRASTPPSSRRRRLRERPARELRVEVAGVDDAEGVVRPLRCGPGEVARVEAVRDRDDGRGHLGERAHQARGLRRVHDDRGRRCEQRCASGRARAAGGAGSGRPASRRAPTGRGGRRPTARRAAAATLRGDEAGLERRHRRVDEIGGFPLQQRPRRPPPTSGRSRPGGRASGSARPRSPPGGFGRSAVDPPDDRPRGHLGGERLVGGVQRLAPCRARSRRRPRSRARAGSARTSRSAERRRRRSAGSGRRGRGRASQRRFRDASELADDPGGNPDGHGVVGHVVPDDRVRADDRAAPDANARAHDDVLAEPGAVPDVDRPDVVRRPGRARAATGPRRRARGRRCRRCARAAPSARGGRGARPR